MKFHFVDDAVCVNLCPDVKNICDQNIEIGLGVLTNVELQMQTGVTPPSTHQILFHIVDHRIP
jgi:hypothetical protein